MVAARKEVKRILIVEDSEEMQQIYGDMFWDQTEKYCVDFEKNAEEALKKVNLRKYELIILDIIMAPMTGDWFFVYLRKGKGMPSIPVLVVSVLGPEILQTGEDLGNVDFLQKPITKKQLFDKIDQLVGRAETQKESS